MLRSRDSGLYRKAGHRKVPDIIQSWEVVPWLPLRPSWQACKFYVTLPSVSSPEEHALKYYPQDFSCKTRPTNRDARADDHICYYNFQSISSATISSHTKLTRMADNVSPARATDWPPAQHCFVYPETIVNRKRRHGLFHLCGFIHML